MTEKELVLLCKSNNRETLKLLYDRYAPWMMGIAMRYTGDKEISRDVLHDSFMKIFGSIERFEYRGAGSLQAWLSKVVVNTALAFLKKENQFTSLDGFIATDNEKNIEVSDESEVELYDLVSDEAIVLCLGSLPAKLRTVFNLFIFEDRSHTDIAVELGISETASRVRLHRAKELLAKEVREYIKRTEQ